MHPLAEIDLSPSSNTCRDDGALPTPLRHHHLFGAHGSNQRRAAGWPVVASDLLAFVDCVQHLLYGLIGLEKCVGVDLMTQRFPPLYGPVPGHISFGYNDVTRALSLLTARYSRGRLAAVRPAGATFGHNYFPSPAQQHSSDFRLLSTAVWS